MQKLHRYYLGEVAISVALTFVVLFGVVMISMLARGIERAQGGDLLDAATIMFLWAVDTFPHLLTMSLLIGTVLVFARASQDREITAIRSAGISPRMPMTAALLVGVLFSLLGMYAMHQLIPAAHGKGRVLISETMLVNQPVRALIRDDKAHQIYSIIQTSKKLGMQTMNAALAEMVLANRITQDEASARSSKPEELKQLLMRT